VRRVHWLMAEIVAVAFDQFGDRADNF